MSGHYTFSTFTIWYFHLRETWSGGGGGAVHNRRPTWLCIFASRSIILVSRATCLPSKCICFVFFQKIWASRFIKEKFNIELVIEPHSTIGVHLLAPLLSLFFNDSRPRWCVNISFSYVTKGKYKWQGNRTADVANGSMPEYVQKAPPKKRKKDISFFSALCVCVLAGISYWL